MKRRVRKKLYKNHLYNLIYDVSLDAIWRKQLFNAPVGKRFLVTEVVLPRLSEELRNAVQQKGLNFTVFNEGWTDDGFVVFGFSCIEFPYIIAYSTNNPEVI